MPGYNHYPWCSCGWCYKASKNFYNPVVARENFDRSYASRLLDDEGVSRSWSACFINPNARCSCCNQRVYYYQNQHGSRVFFNNIGWPWQKHECTDSARRLELGGSNAPGPLVARKRGKIVELMKAAQTARFDPNRSFREEHGHPPADLFLVLEINKVGFENFIRAQSIAPPMDEHRFMTFTSEKITPEIGDFFSFDGAKISILIAATLSPALHQAREITKEAFSASASRGACP